MAESPSVRPSLVDTIVLWLDPTGRIELANGPLERLLGTTEQELQREPIWHWLTELSEADFPVWWKEARVGRPSTKVVDFRSSRDTSLRLSLRTRFIERSNQQFVRCELEPPPEALTGSSLPQWGLRCSRGGAAQWKITTGELLVTSALRALLGVPAKQRPAEIASFMGLMRPVCNPDALGVLIELVRNVQRNGRADEVRIAAALPDRPQARLRVFCEPLQLDGTTTSLRLWVQDITDYERSDQVADQFRQLLLRLPLPVWQLETSGKICGSSPAARQLLGAEEEEAVYADVRQLDIDGLGKQWEDYAERARTASKPIPVEGVLQRLDRKVLPIPLELHYQPELETGPYLLIGTRSYREQMYDRPLVGARLGAPVALSPRETPITDSELGVQIVYKSAIYAEMMRQIRQVSPTDSTVLLLGETGTGKELLARAVHEYSRRRSQALIKVNCAALPDTLAESELFGHEKGAFTGAYAQQIGKFEQADGGTIFLDEVGELSLNVQAKLLRVLQEGEIERVGGKGVQRVDVRVVAATNRNLRAAVEAGTFRGDLYFRLNVFPIINPPLRERPDDILPLAEHLLRKHAQRLNRPVTRISKAAAERLHAYSFPGNVRELENIIERGIILAQSDTLELEYWVQEAPLQSRADAVPSFEDGQRALIDRALRKSRGRVSGAGGAAELLQLNPQTLYSKMRKLGIERGDY